jgi:hypothetical protein
MKKGLKRNESKKWIYFFVISLILVLTFVIVAGSVITSHNPSQISVIIGGQRMTLQQAIDSGDLATGVLNSSWTSSMYMSSMPLVGHTDSDIIITIKATTMTLHDAISTNVFVTGNLQAGFNYAANLPLAGHFGSDINVTIKGITQSLQSAINTKYLACLPSCVGKFNGDSDGCVGTCTGVATYSWSVGAWTGCTSCTGTSDRTVTCMRNGNIPVSDSYCTSPAPQSSSSCACTWQQQNYYQRNYYGPCFCVFMLFPNSLPPCNDVLGTSCNSYGSTGECSCGMACGFLSITGSWYMCTQ